MPRIIARNGAVDLDREAIDYNQVQDPGHGNTAAAWAGVFILLIGATVGTFGNVLGSDITFWIGVVIAVLGPIVGLIMRAAGMGGKARR